MIQKSTVLYRKTTCRYLPFVAVVGTAFWDSAVGFKVVREAKIIAVGVAASVELADSLIASALNTLVADGGPSTSCLSRDEILVAAVNSTTFSHGGGVASQELLL